MRGGDAGVTGASVVRAPRQVKRCEGVNMTDRPQAIEAAIRWAEQAAERASKRASTRGAGPEELYEDECAQGLADLIRQVWETDERRRVLAVRGGA